jgi:hypothetical protein
MLSFLHYRWVVRRNLGRAIACNTGVAGIVKDAGLLGFELEMIDGDTVHFSYDVVSRIVTGPDLAMMFVERRQAFEDAKRKGNGPTPAMSQEEILAVMAAAAGHA